MDAPTLATAQRDTIPARVKMNGLKGLDAQIDSWGNTRGSFTGGTFAPSSGDDKVERGHIRCGSVPIPGGCRLTVDTRHSAPNDRITLLLQCEVLDLSKNKIGLVNLAVLANEANLNGDGFRGQFVADISYGDIDAFLKKRHPQLALNPGTTKLAVSAIWNDKDGKVLHRAGGPARGGSFRCL